MATYSSEAWTGRKPYGWAKNYVCFLHPLIIFELGWLSYIKCFGLSVSFWPRSAVEFGESRHKFHFTKVFVTAEKVMNER